MVSVALINHHNYVAAPPAAPTVGDRWLGPPVPRPKFPIFLIQLIHDFLETKERCD